MFKGLFPTGMSGKSGPWMALQRPFEHQQTVQSANLQAHFRTANLSLKLFALKRFT